MIDCSVLILFCLSVVFPCEGTVNPPPGGNVLFFKHGRTVEIPWSYDASSVSYRAWFFTNSTVTEKEFASINNKGQISIDKNVLPGIAIKEPAILVLQKVDSRYNGVYKFQVVASGGGDSEVRVIIAVTPRIKVEFSRSTTVNTGGSITCICRAEGGNPPANVTWYKKDNVKIGETGNEQQTLELTNVSRRDSGRYKCVAISHKEIAENETSFELIVNFPPENVLTVFSSETAERGKQFTIMCNAEAFPQPTFKIFYNKTKLLINGDTYTIPNVNDGHSGFYHCVAENDLDSVNSTSRYLSVGDVGQSPTTFPTSKTNLGNKTVETETSGSDSLSGGAIAGIVIGVLVVVVIVAGVIYWFKFKPNGKDHGPKKDAEEKSKKKRGDENVYDAVNMDDKASGSRSSHELESPMNYAVLDKQALNTGAPKKPDRNAEESTAYASIDVGKVGQVEADLV